MNDDPDSSAGNLHNPPGSVVPTVLPAARQGVFPDVAAAVGARTNGNLPGASSSRKTSQHRKGRHRGSRHQGGEESAPASASAQEVASPSSRRERARKRRRSALRRRVFSAIGACLCFTAALYATLQLGGALEMAATVAASVWSDYEVSPTERDLWRVSQVATDRTVWLLGSIAGWLFTVLSLCHALRLTVPDRRRRRW